MNLTILPEECNQKSCNIARDSGGINITDIVHVICRQLREGVEEEHTGRCNQHLAFAIRFLDLYSSGGSIAVICL